MNTRSGLRMVAEEEVDLPQNQPAPEMSSNSPSSNYSPIQLQQLLIAVETKLRENQKNNEQIIAWTATALRVLAERTVNAALAFLGLGGAFLLWEAALKDPSWTQLVGLGLYASFILGILFVRRDK
jgi:hypothetical protein